MTQVFNIKSSMLIHFIGKDCTELVFSNFLPSADYCKQLYNKVMREIVQNYWVSKDCMEKIVTPDFVGYVCYPCIRRKWCINNSDHDLELIGLGNRGLCDSRMIPDMYY